VYNNTFVTGLWCDYDEHHGYIRFIGEDYLTLCISNKPNIDPHSRRNINECCLLVFKKDWERIVPCVSSGSH